MVVASPAVCVATETSYFPRTLTKRLLCVNLEHGISTALWRETKLKIQPKQIWSSNIKEQWGPVMSWQLVQGVPCPRPETKLGLAPAATPRDPMERDKRLRTMTWHKGTWPAFTLMIGLEKRPETRKVAQWNVRVIFTYISPCEIGAYLT